MSSRAEFPNLSPEKFKVFLSIMLFFLLMYTDKEVEGNENSAEKNEYGKQTVQLNEQLLTSPEALQLQDLGLGQYQYYFVRSDQLSKIGLPILSPLLYEQLSAILHADDETQQKLLSEFQSGWGERKDFLVADSIENASKIEFLDGTEWEANRYRQFLYEVSGICPLFVMVVPQLIFLVDEAGSSAYYENSAELEKYHWPPDDPFITLNHEAGHIEQKNFLLIKPYVIEADFINYINTYQQTFDTLFSQYLADQSPGELKVIKNGLWLISNGSFSELSKILEDRYPELVADLSRNIYGAGEFRENLILHRITQKYYFDSVNGVESPFTQDQDVRDAASKAADEWQHLLIGPAQSYKGFPASEQDLLNTSNSLLNNQLILVDQARFNMACLPVPNPNYESIRKLLFAKIN